MLFSQIAQWAARQCGRASSFVLALAIIVGWAASGFFFDFSDTWQLIVNTGTTIVTFLMVFLIQNTQNRDTAAIQLKLDELIRVNKSARNTLIDLEDRSEEELATVKAEFEEECDLPESKSTKRQREDSRRASKRRSG